MNISHELTSRQQELLLQGLRYVRSSIALETRDWSEQVDSERKKKYQEIEELEMAIRHASEKPVASM